MATRFSGLQKRCATCVFWGGARELKLNKVNVLSPSITGICANPRCFANKGKATKANHSSCGKYERWPGLK
ncbi:hypothetical protein LJC27_04565 [Christensenellaceae bacterium OttesenSCG-928-M15]|nr:hypothetical protein [Christensenellaceae bacterium OttesenSCG-928-M15]